MLVRTPYAYAKLHSMSHSRLITGPERRRRWRDDEKHAILMAAFSSGAIVVEVAR